MKKKLFVIICLICGVSLFAETGNYSYKDIPYGALYETIKKTFANEDVKLYEEKFETYNDMYLNNVNILPAISKIVPWTNGDTYMIGGSENLIKILHVESQSLWANLSSVTFFFLQTAENKYELFMYRKGYKANEEIPFSDFLTFSDDFAGKISNALGQNYLKRKAGRIVAYKRNDYRSFYSWKDGKINIFLFGLMYEPSISWFTSGRFYKEVFYYNTDYETIAVQQKNKYIEDKKKEEIEKKQKALEKNNLDF